MASSETSRIALMPIQPQYVQAIVAGQKKVEFRRRKFACPVTDVVVYATSPIKKVVAHFRVGHVTEATPRELWQRFRSVAGIDEQAFWAYYDGTDHGVAIGIDQLVVLDRPVSLASVSRSLSVPQSFCYIPSRLFEKLLNGKEAHSEHHPHRL